MEQTFDTILTSLLENFENNPAQDIDALIEEKSKEWDLEKPRDFDPFGQTGFGPFGYNMIDPLKSWCWGSILFYPFKISRFS